MNIFKPLTKIENGKDLIFLAGPCPRSGQKWIDWRETMICELKNAGFDGDIIDPTNPNYDTTDPEYYNKQCSWEKNGLHMASSIIFWIDRNEEHPALTTNIEFGIWCEKAPNSIIVGIPEGSEHCGYIKWVCEKKGIACFDNMRDVATEAAKRFSKQTRLFFTSDTHFSSDRHLELSKRPFLNVEEMDLNLISNWNKTVTSNDIVLHLGDFGNFDVLSKLNFRDMKFINGNYERKEKLNITDSRVQIFENMNIEINNKKILCVHEPISGMKSDFYLFGHIHEKSKVKRNGFNVGTDANNFKPVSSDTVRFYMNAILNHYDDNVFCDICE